MKCWHSPFHWRSGEGEWRDRRAGSGVRPPDPPANKQKKKKNVITNRTNVVSWTRLGKVGIKQKCGPPIGVQENKRQWKRVKITRRHTESIDRSINRSSKQMCNHEHTHTMSPFSGTEAKCWMRRCESVSEQPRRKKKKKEVGEEPGKFYSPF